MGAVVLRAQTCLMCGGPLPEKGRVDRRYCKGACRTLAYRVRRRINAVRPPGPLEPDWAEPNAVVKTMLTSLAQIQARVLDFAHQLEHEELYARLPVKNSLDGTNESEAARLADRSDPALDDLPPFWEEEEASALDSEQTNDRVIDELRIALQQAKEDAAEAEERAALAESQEGTSAHDFAAQRDQLLTELRTERERAGHLDAQVTSLHKQATDIISNLQSQYDYALRENRQLAAKIRELEAQLTHAQESLETWEKVGDQAQQLAARNNTLAAENASLKAELQRLRPPSEHADPLTRLMIDRVKALHWLAVYDARIGNKTTGQRLPSYDAPHILAAAQHQAFAARRDYYFRVRGYMEPKPRWVSEDRLLDEQSEKKIYDDEQFKSNYIFSRMGSARRKAGENP